MRFSSAWNEIQAQRSASQEEATTESEGSLPPGRLYDAWNFTCKCAGANVLFAVKVTMNSSLLPANETTDKKGQRIRKEKPYEGKAMQN